MKQILPLVAVTLLPGVVSKGRCDEFRSAWPEAVERVWVGPDYWANPLQDWRLHGGRLECVVSGGERNVHLLTFDLAEGGGAFATSVRLGRLDAEGEELGPGWVGFKLGVRGLFGDYRDSAVRGYGLHAGVSTDGRLFIGKLDEASPAIGRPLHHVVLRLEAVPAGEQYRLTLTASDSEGTRLAELVRDDVQAEWLVGGVALVCSAGEVTETPVNIDARYLSGWGNRADQRRRGNVRFWFDDWRLAGKKVQAHPERAFGPILFVKYSLDRRVLKLSAQMAPVGGQESQEVRLDVRFGEQWRSLGQAVIDPLARTATFRIEDWDDTRDTPYRLIYALREADGEREHTFEGVVRKNPVDKKQIVVAAFTGNNDAGFPHHDLVAHVKHFDPDVLVYTGDQIYEGVGGYGIQRAPLETATLDYLRKWYLFGWEYRELLKDRPSVCLPDDHDVYHGNIWGAGGRKTSPPGPQGQDKGGYVMPAEWVKMVERTQTAHMPDPFDPTPVEQGIGVYYCDMNYGGVSFAVIEDRKFKSAPAVLLPEAEIYNGWVQNPDFDPAAQSDAPGAVLLGERQLKFLDQWAADWSGGAWMKVVVSQTIFANVATLPRNAKNDGVTPSLKIMPVGGYAEDEKPVADHDSNGWPQTGRNKALRAMRRGFAFHIAGDQHLGSTIQYGVDDWNDAGYALCVPSVANIFPRRWFPPEPGANRNPGAPKYTGEFLDGFGNKMTVHAVSNPHAVEVEPVFIHQRAPGYGIATFDRETRKITMANWPRWVDPAAADAEPYPGWPIAIDQADNYGRKAAAYLPTIEVAGLVDPVVQVLDESDGSVLYTLRISGNRFRPKVFGEGRYTIRVGDPDAGAWQALPAVDSLESGERATVSLRFR